MVWVCCFGLVYVCCVGWLGVVGSWWEFVSNFVCLVFVMMVGIGSFCLLFFGLI